MSEEESWAFLVIVVEREVEPPEDHALRDRITTPGVHHSPLQVHKNFVASQQKFDKQSVLCGESHDPRS